MTEINNSIPYGFGKIDRVEGKKENSLKQPLESAKEQSEQHYIQDTGILGRSQIQGIKGGNIEKSVNEAVEMAKEQPVRMKCSEELFDKLYDDYLDEGLNESDAYMRALLDEEEFLDISKSYKK